MSPLDGCFGELPIVWKFFSDDGFQNIFDFEDVESGLHECSDDWMMFLKDVDIDLFWVHLAIFFHA